MKAEVLSNLKYDNYFIVTAHSVVHAILSINMSGNIPFMEDIKWFR